MKPFRSGRLGKRSLEDLQALDKTIKRFNFDQSARNEREFELAFGSTLAARTLVRRVVTQTDRRSSVVSAQCFGKRHRPDMTIGDGHIAVELKFLRRSTTGFREAIGQAYLCRLRYRFVVVVLILGPKFRDVYTDIAEGREADLEQLLLALASSMKIFTYIAPGFRTRRKPRVLAFHEVGA